MGTFEFLLQGIVIAAQPMNLLYALIGVTLGTAVGVLPGIGPALTVALLLPVTYKLDPAGSLIMFAGIYYGGMYGGSTTSILLNTPGESASVVTALEGNKMARAGRGGPALATAAIGSFVAGLIATLGLAFIAPFVVKFALSFGPREYFALMVLAFVTVSAAFGDSALRGLTALALGLTLGLVGIDLQTGQARLAFGVPDLLDGIEVTTLAVALFAVGEALKVAAQPMTEDKVEPVRGSVWMTAQDWARSWKAWLRGTAIGFPIGAMPAGGAEIGTFLSYSTEKALTSFRDIFWILGGKAKEGGIESLRRYFPNIARAYLIGAASDLFAATFDDDGRVSYERSGTLDVAVAAATKAALAQEGTGEIAVLLSPACASYDQFPNFEVRGDAFRALVKALPGFEAAGR